MHDVRITTFGYLHNAGLWGRLWALLTGRGGTPPPAHITLDLRKHFKDPHINPALRPLTAHDEAVRAAVLITPGIKELIDATTAAVLAYLAGPSAGPVTVAIGCAGGRHRAAAFGMQLSEALTLLWSVPVTLTHRDLDKAVVDR
ncbi:ATPase [Actinoallomurus purpureus]|uniref:RapZ C-terminal domain-containing protein n=1 Tax=Actinoallomurus purpureus TaxID=478114 RepID=UPI00209309F3|nr:RNase adapter RapZ [Actinoallomurus purpureus]MCO6011736.1 ATPase [Actinoallomurus purpureus]